MDFLYVIVGLVICEIMWGYLPQYIFDIDRLFPIKIEDDEIEIVNTIIIYVIFCIAAYSSWGSFQNESWGYFFLFWTVVAIIGFIAELIVEQVRWRLNINGGGLKILSKSPASSLPKTGLTIEQDAKLVEILGLLEEYKSRPGVDVNVYPARMSEFRNIDLYPKDYLWFLAQIGHVVIHIGAYPLLWLGRPETIKFNENKVARMDMDQGSEGINSNFILWTEEHENYVVKNFLNGEAINEDNFSVIGHDMYGKYYGFINTGSGFKFHELNFPEDWDDYPETDFLTYFSWFLSEHLDKAKIF